MTKTYQLTVHNQPLTLTLISAPLKSCCYKCLRRQTIRVISQPQGDFKRQFCASCALASLSELETGEREILRKIRSSLIFGQYEK